MTNSFNQRLLWKWCYAIYKIRSWRCTTGSLESLCNLLSVVLCEIPNQPVQRDHREIPRKERQQRSHVKLNCLSWGWILEHRAIPLSQHWVSPRLHVFPPEAMEMKPWRQTILSASDLNFYLGEKKLCEEKNNMYASHHKKSVSVIMTIIHLSLGMKLLSVITNPLLSLTTALFYQQALHSPPSLWNRSGIFTNSHYSHKDTTFLSHCTSFPIEPISKQEGGGFSTGRRQNSHLSLPAFRGFLCKLKSRNHCCPTAILQPPYRLALCCCCSPIPPSPPSPHLTFLIHSRHTSPAFPQPPLHALRSPWCCACSSYSLGAWFLHRAPKTLVF